jgi:hypothetical protein
LINTLKDVVVVLGNTKDSGLRLRNVPAKISRVQELIDSDLPFAVDIDQSQEANKRMSHQSNTAALRGTVEEGDLCTILLEAVCVEHGCCVGVGMNAVSVGGLVYNHCCAIAIHTDLITVHNL